MSDYNPTFPVEFSSRQYLVLFNLDKKGPLALVRGLWKFKKGESSWHIKF